MTSLRRVAGAVAGAGVANRLIEPLGVYQMMLVGAAILIGQLGLTNYITGARERRRPPAVKKVAATTAAKPAGEQPFGMVFRTRYLLLMR